MVLYDGDAIVGFDIEPVFGGYGDFGQVEVGVVQDDASVVDVDGLDDSGLAGDVGDVECLGSLHVAEDAVLVGHAQEGAFCVHDVGEGDGSAVVVHCLYLLG